MFLLSSTFFFYCSRDPRYLHSFPTRRSSDLLFFALTNAIFDAGICAWDDKCEYASVRPITSIRYLFNGQPVTAWAGPYRNTRTFDGGAWFPYQPSTFPPPPVPAYSSGHSHVSAAGAE